MNDKLLRILVILSFLLLLAIAAKLFLYPTPCNCCPAVVPTPTTISPTTIPPSDTGSITGGDTTKKKRPPG